MAKYNLKYSGSEMDELLDDASSLSGIIVMWSGAIDKIPTGWLLCDGTNGTPDLRNRFIVGAGTDYSVGNTGGSNNVVLTTSQMPSHTHGGSVTISSGGAHTHDIWFDGGNSYADPYSSAGYHDVLTSESVLGVDYYSATPSFNDTDNYIVTDGDSDTGGGSHSHTGTISLTATGSGSSHENRPPYYALAYIMKV